MQMGELVKKGVDVHLGRRIPTRVIGFIQLCWQVSNGLLIRFTGSAQAHHFIYISWCLKDDLPERGLVDVQLIKPELRLHTAHIHLL